MLHKVKLTRQAIRARCKRLADPNTACSGLSCWFTVPRGTHNLETLQQSPTCCTVWHWDLDYSSWRGKVKTSMESITTFPKWLGTNHHYELKLLSLTVMFKFWKSQWCMTSTMRFLKFYTNDVQQTCFESLSYWEMEGLWENLWAHSLA